MDGRYTFVDGQIAPGPLHCTYHMESLSRRIRDKISQRYYEMMIRFRLMYKHRNKYYYYYYYYCLKRLRTVCTHY